MEVSAAVSDAKELVKERGLAPSDVPFSTVIALDREVPVPFLS
jgi:hypothetical protein